MGANKYRLVDFFDVWGNAKDGFEVNNQCVVEEGLWLADDITDKEIVKFLKEIGYLATDDLRRISVVDFGDNIEIQMKNGCPICELELEF